jgi:type II secretory pathway pseudopilin PulG
MRFRDDEAFTLVEIIVALAATSVLVVLMLRIFSDGSTIWQRNNEKLDTFREARAALQAMARDFSSLSPAGSAPDQFPVLTGDWHKDTKDEDRVNKEIYGLVSTRNAGRADWCAVGYYCEWDDTKKAFVLKRQFTESDETFKLLKIAAIAQQAIPSGQIFNGRPIFDAVFARTQTIDDMASYVWDLQVEIPDPTDATKTAKWPWGSLNRPLPEWVEIRFKALGTNAARKMTGQNATREMWFANSASSGTDRKFYEHNILPGEQQFATRIKLCR